MFINATDSSSIPTTDGSSTTEMGKDQFLELFIAQLENQDPLNPTENEEFVAQLAQFSALEQSIAQNENLQTLIMTEYAQVKAGTVSYIGKEIQAAGDWVNYEKGTEASMNFELLGDAEEVTVSIYDEDGNLVREMDLADQTHGTVSFTWDGKDKNNSPMASGRYTYEVSAKDADDNKVEAIPLVTGVVTGVDFSEENPMLMIGDEAVSIADVIAVLNADGTKSDPDEITTASNGTSETDTLMLGPNGISTQNWLNVTNPFLEG